MVGPMFDNEGQLQTASITVLELAGAFVENRSPSPWGPKGVPDITGILLGRGFAIELKNPTLKGPPRENDKRWPLQQAHLRHVEKAGGYALGTNIISAVHDLITAIRDDAPSSKVGYYREAWYEGRRKRGP
jgi:hypothetical protein